MGGMTFKRIVERFLSQGNEFEVLFFMLEDKGMQATRVDIQDLKCGQGEYDYVVMADALERTMEPREALNSGRKIFEAIMSLNI